MSVTQEQFDAAQEQLVVDVGIIHQFTTADETTEIAIGGGNTVPSLAKIVADTVLDLDALAPKTGDGTTGTWPISVTGNAATVTTLTKAQTESALGGAVVLAASKGAASGVCELDANLLVPAIRLPSYVDDVIEVATKAALPATGEDNKIYIVIADESRSGQTTQYRWGGSVYSRISSAPGTSDEVPEGTNNKYFQESRVRDTVLAGFTAGSAVKVTATDDVEAAIGKLQGQLDAIPYDTMTFVSGKPAAGAEVLFVKAGRAFRIPANFAGAKVKGRIAATAASVWTLTKNGVTAGTFSWAGAATAPTLATAGGVAIDVAIDDELVLTAAGTQDATLANVAVHVLATLTT